MVANLRTEQYHHTSSGSGRQITEGGAIRGMYYLARPFLPVGLRKHLQKIHLKGWDQITFRAGRSTGPSRHSCSPP